MTRARTRIPLLPDFNLGNRQRRTHRYLDGVREVLARGLLAPIDDGAFPHLTSVAGNFAPATGQQVLLTGTHLLQDSDQATATTDDGGAGEMRWTILVPGVSGNEYSVELVDNPGGGLGFVFAWSGTALTIDYDSLDGNADGSDDLETAVLDYATNPTVASVLKVQDIGGAGALAEEDVDFTSGTGHGDFGVEIAGVAQEITDWTATTVTAMLDLSGFSNGDMVEMLVIADGIEYRFNQLVFAGGAPAGGGRVGVGAFYGLNQLVANGDDFTINGRQYACLLAPAGASGADIEIAITAVDTDTNVDEIVAGINADAARDVDAAPIGPPAGFTGVALIPHNPAGNHAIVHTLTDWEYSAGASPSAMVDGSANPLTLLPFQHTFAGQEGVAITGELAQGRWVHIASFPSTTEPLLAGIVVMDAGSHFSPANLETRFAQDAAGMWSLQVLDGAGMGLANGHIISGFVAV